MLFFRKDEPCLAIRFRNKDSRAMLGVAFVATVEFCKHCAVNTRGRSSACSAAALLLLYSVQEVVPHVGYVQEQPEAGSVVDHIELSVVVSKVVMQEQGRNPAARASPGERVEEGVGRWIESGALEARFSPQSRRASFG
jgi:hypothetical protein